MPNVQDSNNNDGQPSALDADCISIMPDFEQTSYLITTGLNITNNNPADCSAVLGAGSTVYATTAVSYTHLGRFTEQKNQPYSLKIAQCLKNMNHRFKMLLIGEGKWFDYIRKMAKDCLLYTSRCV